MHLHGLAEGTIRRVPHVAFETLALEGAFGVDAGMAARPRDLTLIDVCRRTKERARGGGKSPLYDDDLGFRAPQQGSCMAPIVLALMVDIHESVCWREQGRMQRVGK